MRCAAWHENIACPAEESAVALVKSVFFLPCHWMASDKDEAAFFCKSSHAWAKPGLDAAGVCYKAPGADYFPVFPRKIHVGLRVKAQVQDIRQADVLFRASPVDGAGFKCLAQHGPVTVNAGDGKPAAGPERFCKRSANQPKPYNHDILIHPAIPHFYGL